MEVLKTVGSLMLLLGMSPAAFAGFLSMPLSCGDSSCSFVYNRGAYTYLAMNSVLDHSMVVNPNGRYPYREPGTTRGLNGIVKAFNGEPASGPTYPGDVLCVGGTILLKPTPSSPKGTEMTNASGCYNDVRYASYDEHPGYDYRAAYGTSVKAAASGYVVNGSAGRCVPNGIGSCDSWGYVGIDHQNGYISQYGHLKIPTTLLLLVSG
jgi:murein DD-endopeptidase MepM/ murein hydrolase activator NlpD